MKIMRQVIVLDPTLKIDEVDMSYKAFVEQFKGQLVSYIIRDKGWTITKATNFLESKFNYDPYIYNLMMEMIKNDRPMIILNRNPE